MIEWWKAWRARNPAAPLRRLLFWELIRHITFFWVWLFYRVRAYDGYKVPASGPVLLLCNHQSYLDLILLGAGLPQRHFHPMARKTLFNNALFGAAIRNLNSIELDQSKGDIKAIRAALDLLNTGQMMLLFPEGRRTSDGRVQELQEGVWLLLRRAKSLVVPAAVEGVYDAWPIRGRPRLTARVAVMFGDPIPSEKLVAMGKKESKEYLRQTIDALRRKLRDRIRFQTDGRYPLPGPVDS